MIEDSKGGVKGVIYTITWSIVMIAVFQIANIKNQNEDMPKGIPFILSEEDKQKIRDEYLVKPVKRLADEIGCSGTKINGFLNRNDLVIPRYLIEQRKKDSQRKKGDTPFNKGRKQSEYMSLESIKKA